MQSSRFAVNGHTFVIHLFLGDFPEDPNEWEAAESHIGVISIFGGGLFSSGQCSNCSRQAESEETSLVTGQTSITNALLDLIENKTENKGELLPSLEREHVGPFLRKALHWRITTASIRHKLMSTYIDYIMSSQVGNVIYDLRDVPSLKVSVGVSKATLPLNDGDFIEFGEFEVLDVTTQGRTAGFDLVNDSI